MSQAEVTNKSASVAPRAVKLTVVRAKQTQSARARLSNPEVQHEIAEDAHIRSFKIPSHPLVYSFAKQRGWIGLQCLAASLACLGIGGFIASQIPTTPKLSIQMGLIAIVCSLLGLYILTFAVRDLFGKLRIDSNGIRMSPGFLGFFIPWNELSQWNVDLETFRFHTPKSKAAFTTSGQVLSSGDRQELRELLRACVAEKEGRTATAATTVAVS